MKIKFILIVLVLLFTACSLSQPTGSSETPEEELNTDSSPLIEKPYFEERQSLSYTDLFEDPKPERCLKSHDVDGEICTEEIWSANLDEICNGDQIEAKFASTCIWRQFEYCNKLGEYSGTETEQTNLIDKDRVYNCTDFLILKSIREWIGYLESNVEYYCNY